jgi:twitching motility protein PilT
MVVTPAIANLIRENKTYRIDSSIQTGKKLGMQLLDEHLWRLYDTGRINLQEMLDKGRQPGALQDKANEKISAMRGKQKVRKKEAQKEMEDLGPILRGS